MLDVLLSIATLGRFLPAVGGAAELEAVAEAAAAAADEAGTEEPDPAEDLELDSIPVIVLVSNDTVNLPFLLVWSYPARLVAVLCELVAANSAVLLF